MVPLSGVTSSLVAPVSPPLLVAPLPAGMFLGQMRVMTNMAASPGGMERKRKRKKEYVVLKDKWILCVWFERAPSEELESFFIFHWKAAPPIKPFGSAPMEELESQPERSSTKWDHSVY